MKKRRKEEGKKGRKMPTTCEARIIRTLGDNRHCRCEGCRAHGTTTHRLWVRVSTACLLCLQAEFLDELRVAV